eukprot:362196-Chlamydomonas_euryale.AAC.3
MRRTRLRLHDDQVVAGLKALKRNLTWSDSRCSNGRHQLLQAAGSVVVQLVVAGLSWALCRPVGALQCWCCVPLRQR